MNIDERIRKFTEQQTSIERGICRSVSEKMVADTMNVDKCIRKFTEQQASIERGICRSVSEKMVADTMNVDGFIRKLTEQQASIERGIRCSVGEQALAYSLNFAEYIRKFIELQKSIDLSSQRVMEAVRQAALSSQSMIDTAVKPQMAFQDFARDQLGFGAYASGIARANRFAMVNAASGLLNKMNTGFTLGARMYPASVEREVTSEPVVNVFTELTLELEGVDLEEPEASTGEAVLESRAAQVTDLGESIVRLVYDLNLEAERQGKSPIFKPTNKALYSCAIIPTHVAIDEQGFSDVIDHLFFLLYEGSGEGKRLTERRSREHLEALWLLKHLRVGFRHDLDHGSTSDVIKKNLQTGKAYKSLIGQVAPRTKHDWINAQISLYGQIGDMLRKL
jgi:hypothetical protein